MVSASTVTTSVSTDQNAFVTSTSSATELATTSGIYFVDLTAGELNVDTTVFLAEVDGAKATPVILYREEEGDIRVSVSSIDLGTYSGVTFGIDDIASATITAAAIATDAIGAAELAADAANEIADALLDRTDGVELGITVRQSLRGISAGVLGQSEGLDTSLVTYFEAGSENTARILASVNTFGTRSSVTLTLS